MIQSTEGKRAARQVRQGFPGGPLEAQGAMLSVLDPDVAVEDLRFPPDNNLEQLKGNRAGRHSVGINGQWRICFVWTQNGPAEVKIVD
ncbi:MULTISPECIES: type II toxin-antitoxin system RelE/ParE family toxin [Roseobacteraceae]|uniref:type II toxin-antitoxin system RelE/ParE family toxin n=1 Tax=Roseobacteraceae TaxID=2854170 RepID=UPI00125FC515|nr:MULTISPECIES: type II toxin-antitoxin system RelE/ParE family toxin [Roseobacteraceae]KAB6718042.1 plasmid maintenance system killer [Roseobacter sp. TSBP12]|tara:strand:+ start:2193 stop:2456 length:264 start_codon:yes stop_codon:yes gene_type:complete